MDGIGGPVAAESRDLGESRDFGESRDLGGHVTVHGAYAGVNHVVV